jgi:hypothetical protein
MHTIDREMVIQPSFFEDYYRNQYGLKVLQK